MPASPPPLRATLREVAERAGVAVITASRVLNGGHSGLPVSPETRARVSAAAAAMGYRPHAAGRTLRAQRTGQVGCLVLNNPERPLTNLAAYEYLLGINAGLAEAEVLLTQVRITDLDGEDPGRVRVLRECTLDGFVVVGHIPAPVSAFLERHAEHTVWLDTDRDAPHDCLRRAEREAGTAAAGLLLAAGRRRVVWLQRPEQLRDHYSLRDREAGARAACAAAGADFIAHPGAPGSGLGDPGPLARELAIAGTGLLLADPGQARWAGAFLGTHALTVGSGLGVAACDIDTAAADAWPGLSGVRVDRYALGVAAARMLLARIASGRPQDSRTLASPVLPGTTA